MGTNTGTNAGMRTAVLAFLIAAALLPVRWQAPAKQVWSYWVYCVGYRLLSFGLDGSAVATVVTFGVKHAASMSI